MPLTLLRLEAQHEVCVVELGMDHAGEIDNLARLVEPDMALITNIGDAHIENLGSRENMRLAAAVDTKPAAVDYGLLCGLGQLGLQQEQDLAAAIRRESA